MSCVLRISGENLDIDSFIARSGIFAYRRFYKGDARLKSKPNGPKVESSGCTIEVSKAEFHDFKEQVEDAISYLATNRDVLSLIRTTPDIEYAVLDFGVSYDDNKFTQTHFFSTELLSLTADLGISIELSIYHSTNE